MHAHQQEHEVLKFFDRIAHDYRKKYEEADPLLYYFFTDRLTKATADLKFDDKLVLDIGSGTGALYDYLALRHRMAGFYACDISEKMLGQSRVPAKHRFVGKVHEIEFPVETFDYIYMLGVSTYLTKSELVRNLEFIESNLKKDGVAIISFTNRGSLDHRMRMIARPLLRIRGGERNVLVQRFRLHAYTVKEVARLMEPGLSITKITYLNHTVFPASCLFKKSSVKTARLLDNALKNRQILSICSSDFIVFMKQHGQVLCCHLFAVTHLITC